MARLGVREVLVWFSQQQGGGCNKGRPIKGRAGPAGMYEDYHVIIFCCVLKRRYVSSCYISTRVC